MKIIKQIYFICHPYCLTWGEAVQFFYLYNKGLRIIGDYPKFNFWVESNNYNLAVNLAKYL